MSKKTSLGMILVVMMASMVFGTSAVLADGGGALVPVYDEDNGWSHCFADGRINGCTLDAPVAIYIDHVEVVSTDANGVPAWNEDGTPAYQDEITGVEMWGIVSGYDNLLKVMDMSLAEIQAAVAAANGADVTLSQNYGYAFGHSASGYFWVTAPDGYSFAWDASTLLG